MFIGAPVLCRCSGQLGIFRQVVGLPPDAVRFGPGDRGFADGVLVVVERVGEFVVGGTINVALLGLCLLGSALRVAFGLGLLLGEILVSRLLGRLLLRGLLGSD